LLNDHAIIGDTCAGDAAQQKVGSDRANDGISVGDVPKGLGGSWLGGENHGVCSSRFDKRPRLLQLFRVGLGTAKNS
jgi:hypothetical protein